MITKRVPEVLFAVPYSTLCLDSSPFHHIFPLPPTISLFQNVTYYLQFNPRTIQLSHSQHLTNVIHQLFIALFMLESCQQTLSDNNEGFEAQQICIEKRGEVETIPRVNAEDGNDIIDDVRPRDFLPRSAFKELPLKPYPEDIDVICKFEEPQKLVPIPQEPNPKAKKYLSLEQKYRNSFYPLVYQKFPLDSETYLHSYINLQKVLDPTPSNSKTFTCKDTSSSLFDSNFQSGNLLYSYLTSPNTYDLILQNDTNTRGYSQWFYFSFQFSETVDVAFNVVNMIKKKTLFELGVKPCFFVQEGEGEGRWRQVGQGVRYYKNGVQRENGEAYYTLGFRFRPERAGKVYFSLNLPYTYTKMVKLVRSIEKIQSNEFTVQTHTLCYSLSNNQIPYLTFRSKSHNPTKQILFFARQHPGQTISSYIMQFLLKALIANPRLLQKFEVIYVPILNVDGVIYGNFRTNLAGYDINRQWKETDKWMNPQVFALKRLIKKQPNLQFVLDLHGHSKKFNSFIYSCKQQNKFQEKLFPFLMSKNELFKIESCTYGLSKDKVSTARAYMKGLGINHIYTLETSFYGYGGEGGYYRFEERHFESLGKTIVSAVEELFFSRPEDLEKYQVEISQIMEKQENLFNNGSNASGSDSNPDEDELSENEREIHVIPAQILEQKKSKETEQNFSSLKRRFKSIKIVQKEKEKRSESLYNSNKELNTDTKYKYEFRKAHEYSTSRSQNKSIKPMPKTMESEERMSVRVMKSEVQEDRNQFRKVIVNKKRPRQMKQFVSTKRSGEKVREQVGGSVKGSGEGVKDSKKVISSLFLSSMRRNSIKQKRTHKSLVDERLASLSKEENQIVSSYKQKHTSNLKQLLNTSMMIQTNYKFKEANRLDRIVQQRIREKMTQSALTSMPKVRRNPHSTGDSRGEESNLLQRSYLSNGLLIDQTKQEFRESISRVSRKTRNNRNKKQLIFLSELMRPKVEHGKGYQIEVIGSNSESHSTKGKRVMYLNKYI